MTTSFFSRSLRYCRKNSKTQNKRRILNLSYDETTYYTTVLWPLQSSPPKSLSRSPSAVRRAQLINRLCRFWFLFFFFFSFIDIENSLRKTKQRFILSLPANRHVSSAIHLLLYRRRRVPFCFAHAFPPPTRTKSARSIRSGTKRTSSHDSRVTTRIFPAGISNSIAFGY